MGRKRHTAEQIIGKLRTAENDPGGEGAGGPVMPEPNAALMFALGLGIVSRSIRKRR
jgi:hypothetical protein